MAERILWAPWRSAFVLSKKEKGCPLCKALRAREDSGKNLILYRGDSCFVIMNKFPYNTGHLMICPKRHISKLDKLTSAESDELMTLTRQASHIINRVLKPHSQNLGMNLGRSSGAGIPEHLHMHIVPRWNGDTSFMLVVGNTKVVSVPLDPVYQALRKEFGKL